MSTSKRPAAWAALASHAQSISKVHLRQLFADDPKRGQRMALEAVGLYLDHSKNRMTATAPSEDRSRANPTRGREWTS